MKIRIFSDENGGVIALKDVFPARIMRITIQLQGVWRLKISVQVLSSIGVN